MRLRIAAGFATLLFQTAGIAAPVTADPFDGIWKLDVERSQFAPQDRPVEMTIAIHTEEQSVQYDSETHYQNGRVAQMHYTARYDGRPALVTGTVGLMIPVSLKRLDFNTVEAVYVRGFQVVATSRRAISEHGKLMTIMTTSAESARESTASVAVFVKVEDPQVALPVTANPYSNELRTTRDCRQLRLRSEPLDGSQSPIDQCTLHFMEPLDR